MITKTFLGECVAVVGKRIYAMRPSFAALWTIEQQTGVSIPQAIQHIDSPHCRAEVVRFVIEQGVHSLNPQATQPKLSKKQWLAHREAAITLLIQGLGYHINTAHESMAPAATVMPVGVSPAQGSETAMKAEASFSSSPFTPLNWPQLYKTATGLLGKTEAEFWCMTYSGLLLQCEAYAASQGIEIAEVGHPATPDDLHHMMQQYPDAQAA